MVTEYLDAACDADAASLADAPYEFGRLSQ